MFAKKRNQQNDLALSDYFTLQNFCKFHYLYFMCL